MTDKIDIEKLARDSGITNSVENTTWFACMFASISDLSRFGEAYHAAKQAERDAKMADGLTDSIILESRMIYSEHTGTILESWEAALRHALSRVRPQPEPVSELTDDIVASAQCVYESSATGFQEDAMRAAGLYLLSRVRPQPVQQDRRAVDLSRAVQAYLSHSMLGIGSARYADEEEDIHEALASISSSILADERPDPPGELAYPGDTPCCGDWEFCRKMCIPRANHWKEYAKSLEMPQPLEGKQPIKRGRFNHSCAARLTQNPCIVFIIPH